MPHPPVAPETRVLDTVDSIRGSFASDLWGSWPARAAAYAHAIGEACAVVVPRVALPLSGITATYVLLSAADRGRRAREMERYPDISTLVGRKVICEQFVTQWAGLVYLPTAVVGGASSLLAGAMRSATLGLPPVAVRYLPIAAPLLLVPFAVPATTALCDAASAWALQPLLDSVWPTAGKTRPKPAQRQHDASLAPCCPSP